MKYLESKIKEKVMERSTVEENSLTSLLNKIFRSLIKQYEKLLVKEFGMNFINQVFSELNTKISNESNYVLLFLINSIFFLFGVCLKKNKNVSMVNSENSSHKGQILFFSMIKENYERILILTQNKNYEFIEKVNRVIEKINNKFIISEEASQIFNLGKKNDPQYSLLNLIRQNANTTANEKSHAYSNSKSPCISHTGQKEKRKELDEGSENKNFIKKIFTSPVQNKLKEEKKSNYHNYIENESPQFNNNFNTNSLINANSNSSCLKLKNQNKNHNHNHNHNYNTPVLQKVGTGNFLQENYLSEKIPNALNMDNQNCNKVDNSNSILTIEQNNCNNSINSTNKSFNSLYKKLAIRDIERVSEKKLKNFNQPAAEQLVKTPIKNINNNLHQLGNNLNKTNTLNLYKTNRSNKSSGIRSKKFDKITRKKESTNSLHKYSQGNFINIKDYSVIANNHNDSSKFETNNTINSSNINYQALINQITPTDIKSISDCEKSFNRNHKMNMTKDYLNNFRYDGVNKTIIKIRNNLDEMENHIKIFSIFNTEMREKIGGLIHHEMK